MRRLRLSACVVAVSCLSLLVLGSSKEVFSENGSTTEAKAQPSDSDIWTKAVSGLVEVLKSGKDKEARKAAAMLASIGPIPSSSRRMLPQLIKILESDDIHAKHHALYALGEMGEGAIEAVPAIAQLLNDKDEKLRASALENLRDILICKSCSKGPRTPRDSFTAIQRYEQKVRTAIQR